MNEFKPKSIKEILDKHNGKTDPAEQLDELEGEFAFARGEALPPSASDAFKRGYEKKKAEVQRFKK